MRVTLVPFVCLWALFLRAGAEVSSAGADGARIGRRLVWSDEFDGTSLDGAKWCFGATMGAADHLYANDARTVGVGQGRLSLHVQPSPDPKKVCLLPHGVTTKATMAFRYGYLEMRARVPFRRGAWPSFWMLSTPGLRKARWMSEIDIFEVFAHTNRLNSCLHKWGRSAKTGKNAHVLTPGGERARAHWFANPEKLNDEFHVYGLEWTPEAVSFFVDGTMYARCPIDEQHDYVAKSKADLLPGMAGHHDFHYVIFNNEVFTPRCSWRIDEDRMLRPEDLPIDYQIDWVRLWQKEGEELMTGKAVREAVSEAEKDKAKKSASLAAGGLQGEAAEAPHVKLGDHVADGRPEKRWRGFNLLEMFQMGKDRRPKDFREEDFQIIRDWGFNFVRLPMDYRLWIKDGDWRNWEEFDEAHLAYIDRAVALGRKYGVHVCLNMHRCPGYTVAKPREPRNLFTDPEAQRVCAKHWAMFARRYRGIPSRELSFNLLNEPPNVGDAAYGEVAKGLVAAIRREDPDRFVIVDGLAFGCSPVVSLVGLKGVGQATRGYAPMSVSHYLASWVGTPSAPPRWPIPVDGPSGILGGVGKRKEGMNVPFVVRDLPPCKAVFGYGRVSGKVELEFSADGQPVQVLELVPSMDDPQWANAKRCEQWGNLIQATYKGTSEVSLPAGAKALSVRVKSGDWVSLAEMRIFSDNGKVERLPFEDKWGTPMNFDQRFMGFGSGFRPTQVPVSEPRHADVGREYLDRRVLQPWNAAIADGVFCFCGEFGVWNRTPHAITLDVIEDYLALWKERNMGWAMWNLRGGFGVLDSGRADVEYEDFRGHKLDRKLLELLQRY